MSKQVRFLEFQKLDRIIIVPIIILYTLIEIIVIVSVKNSMNSIQNIVIAIGVFLFSFFIAVLLLGFGIKTEVIENQVIVSAGHLSKKCQNVENIVSKTLSDKNLFSYGGLGFRYLGGRHYAYIAKSGPVVSLEFKDGTHIALGTNDPCGLMEALEG